MFMNAKNGTVRLADGYMDYIRFGSGKKNLIILAGLGESLRFIRGTAIPMALLYRRFAKEYTVYSFGRKYPLTAEYATREMARDQIEAMDSLGIVEADVIGVSMGGMIAQFMAVDYPDRIGKLVLAVTCAYPNPILNASVAEWISYARRNDHRAFMESNLRLIYSDKYYRRNRWMIPIIGRLTKPESYDRFFTQANACLEHNALGLLGEIRAETLVIGGDRDAALGGDASWDIAAAIPKAHLKMYPEGTHGLYEEETDFQQTILNFLIG